MRSTLTLQIRSSFTEALGDNVDIIKIGDDLGTQESLMMSPAMYRRILQPVHEDYIRFIRERTKAKVFFHTDGDVFPLIDDFVEMGIDCITGVDPVQDRLDLQDVKRSIGSQICLMGGANSAMSLGW